MYKINLHIVHPGLQTTIQDQGRHHYAAYGVPIGGALDRYAAQLGNWLVDNPLDHPVLEITYSGPKILIQGGCQIAITGANITPHINEQPIPLWQTITLSDTTTLSFGQLKDGCRCYLAIRGNWNIPTWLGSYSTLSYGDVTSALDKGDTLEIHLYPPIETKTFQPPFTYSNHIEVRVLPGPEFSWFTPASLNNLISQNYRLSPQCNRMGYRLEGQPLKLKEKKEMISSGIIPGTIQVTGSGHPIILLADAQTTGGYPRIANVISTDVDTLAQLKPGDEVKFKIVPLSEAQELYRKRAKVVGGW